MPVDVIKPRSHHTLGISPSVGMVMLPRAAKNEKHKQLNQWYMSSYKKHVLQFIYFLIHRYLWSSLYYNITLSWMELSGPGVFSVYCVIVLLCLALLSLQEGGPFTFVQLWLNLQWVINQKALSAFLLTSIWLFCLLCSKCCQVEHFHYLY